MQLRYGGRHSFHHLPVMYSLQTLSAPNSDEATDRTGLSEHDNDAINGLSDHISQFLTHLLHQKPTSFSEKTWDDTLHIELRS